MLTVKEAIIVEGRYDRIKLSGIVNAPIIETGGFRVFSDPEKQALIRQIAAKRGILVFTDSDGAGFQIRNSLKGCIGSGRAVNVYIPDVFGKERRKDKPSKEGKLGVEGIDPDVLREAFAKAGVSGCTEPRTAWIDRQRLAEDGLSGSDNSSELRRELCAKLGLPERMTSKALLEALNTLCTENEYTAALAAVKAGE